MAGAATLLELFPWLSQVGITLPQLQQWVIDYAGNAEAIVAESRKSEGWKVRFAGNRRPDGTLRMSEANYIAREGDYRVLLRQYARPDYEYNDPSDFTAFFEQELDPNEVKDRFETYEAVRRGSQDIKDTFYVYAGMRLSDDDLYSAMVNPTDRQKLADEYNARVAKSPLDYATWITRATEAGLERVTATLAELQQNGVVTGDAITRLTQTDPTFARTIADALYHGGSPGEGPFLSLTELMHSFQYALIGGAATAVGLNAPSKERVEALRQAGITRARALEGYASFANNKNLLEGMVQRARLANQFSQEDFEKAVFLQSGTEADLLARAQGFEKSLGQSGGSAGLALNGQQLAQRGLRAA